LSLYQLFGFVQTFLNLCWLLASLLSFIESADLNLVYGFFIFFYQLLSFIEFVAVNCKFLSTYFQLSSTSIKTLIFIDFYGSKKAKGYIKSLCFFFAIYSGKLS
jgi:hypothetical protein